MLKIIKIKFLIFFFLISVDCNAVIKPPLDNILVSKNPIEYHNIDFEDFYHDLDVGSTTPFKFARYLKDTDKPFNLMVTDKDGKRL